MSATTHLQPPGADRRRPDRLVDRARGARARRRALDRRHRPLRRDAPARRRARACRSGGRDQRGRGRRRRSRHRLHSGRRLRRGRGRDRPASQAPARSSPTSARSRARWCATWRRTFPRACISCPRIPVAGTEILRAGRGLRRAVRQPLVHPDAAAGRTTPAAVERLAAFWRALGANVETMTAEHHDLVLGITSHLPHLIAYTIVGTADELRPGHALGGAEILRRRLPRFHPHRRLRPDHVARRLPRQQGRGAGNARPLQRGPLDADARDPPRRRRRRCSSTSPARARSAAASSRSARIRRRPTSAARIPSCRTSRCRGPMRRMIDRHAASVASGLSSPLTRGRQKGRHFLPGAFNQSFACTCFIRLTSMYGRMVFSKASLIC